MQARMKGKLLIILACTLFMGGPALPGQDLEEIAAGIARDFPAKAKQYESLVQELVRKDKSRFNKQMRQVAPEPLGPSGERILVFITLGEKPEEHIEENRRMIKEIHDASPEAILVLRGLPQGHKTLGDLFRYLRAINEKGGPTIILNPPLFQLHEVTVVPTLVYERDGAAVATARGIIDAQWLKRRVEQEKATGDLGKWGQTADIAERDLVDEMKSRLAGIDWQSKKEQVVSQYWQKQKFLELPPTPKERVFYLNASYKVQRDFVLPDGKVIARAGDEVDLFKIIPPTFILVVFDAGDPRQLEWAKKAGKQYSGHLRVKYITTRIPDQEHGWDSLARLHDTLQDRVYLLNDQVRERFKLQHVPSLVRYIKDKHRFEVKEEVCVKE